MDKINKTNDESFDLTQDEWKKRLDPQTYHVTREGGTEAPFTGKYVDNQEQGIFKCSNCGLDLFSSDTKFESGTGWPSFTEPTNRENIDLVPDMSGGMQRVEVRCKRCSAHLGHVFDDGPKDKGGQRFCLNSCALNLEK